MACNCLFNQLFILETDILKSISNATVIDDKGKIHHMVKNNEFLHFIINCDSGKTFKFSTIDNTGSIETSHVIPHNQTYNNSCIDKLIIDFLTFEILVLIDGTRYRKVTPKWKSVN